MKILYAAMKYDYGKPEQGFSFEHSNFYESLSRMGHEVIYFDFMSLLQESGRDGMNSKLKKMAFELRPELAFFCLFQDEFDFEAVRQISDSGVTKTLNWFCDDHVRFESFSSRWAPAFNFVVTTASGAVPKYEQIGYPGLIKSQWACNHFLYRRQDLPQKHDVSFVGLAHGIRPKIIARIRAAGINVYTRGLGWPEGRIEFDEMLTVFNQSRINLNLTNASKTPSLWKRLTGREKQIHQIKGRNFEVPGCGSFLLTHTADDLQNYYLPGREIGIFQSDDEMIDQIRYFLAHSEEREDIARAGMERTLREHTYERRFNEIFARMGLPAPVS